MPTLRERRHLSDDARAAHTRGGQRWECAECAASTSSSRPPDKGRPASRASSTALSGTPVGSRGFRGRLRLALLPGGRRGQPCSFRKQRQSRRRRPTHRLLVVLGDLVQTTAGKRITPSANAMPQRAQPRSEPGAGRPSSLFGSRRRTHHVDMSPPGLRPDRFRATA